MTVGAAIPVTRPARKHLRPRQGLEALIATRSRQRRFVCNSLPLAGASGDTGLAYERRRLAFPAEEVADERDEMVLENLQATFGSEAGVRRHHHSQQLGVEGLVDSVKSFNQQVERNH